jgi:hypothetical protein
VGAVALLLPGYFENVSLLLVLNVCQIAPHVYWNFYNFIYIYIYAIIICTQDTAFQVVKFFYLLNYCTPIVNIYFCCNVLTSFKCHYLYCSIRNVKSCVP